MPGASISGAPVAAAPNGPAGGILSGTYPNPGFAPADAPLLLQATTGVGGFALTAGTPNILSWTAPNDGQVHRIILVAKINAVSEVGGQLNVSGDIPGGASYNQQVLAGSLGSGVGTAAPISFLVQAGTTITLALATALTGGSATVYAEFWGS